VRQLILNARAFWEEYMSKAILVVLAIMAIFGFTFTGCDTGINLTTENNEGFGGISKNVSFHNKYEQFLIENNIPIYFIENDFIVSENISEYDLMSFLSLLKFEMDIICDNMANVNTVRTEKGGVYKRNELAIDNGKAKIIKDNTPTRIVYDPLHPDAIQSGPRAGYVEMPNVDIIVEMENLIEVSKFYDNIADQYISNDY
jgi:flagellar basal-body rod protein FlgC